MLPIYKLPKSRQQEFMIQYDNSKFAHIGRNWCKWLMRDNTPIKADSVLLFTHNGAFRLKLR